jgi:hypothetical protein
MKTQTTSTLFISITIVICLSGCQSMYYYAPNAQNVPMFKEKNEVRISAAYCSVGDASDDPIEGFEIQSAYAAGRHFAIMINASKAVSAETNSYVAEKPQKTNMVEFGAGYFKPFHKDKLVVEAYGGFGGGKFENHYRDAYDPSYNINSLVHFKRLFFQPSIAFSSPYFGVAFSLRAALLLYDQKPEMYLSTSYFLVEPCFTVRAGWKGLKFQSQLQLSNNVTDPAFPQHHINFNTGICLTLPVKKTTE